MRHAKAVREPGLSDHARALTTRGRDDAALVARFLAEHGLAPDLAIASDSRRTRETLDVAMQAFATAPATKLEPRLYLAEPREIMKVVRAAPADAQKLLIVAHNPGIAELALALTGGGAHDDVRRLAGSFPTCAVAVISFTAEWANAAELQGRLERFIVASRLREAARPPEPDT